MYVTGGFGPSASNEGFTRDYDLPNDTAYAETCASVAMVFWAARMLNLDLDGRYADILELALFNNALAGLSRDGTCAGPNLTALTSPGSARARPPPRSRRTAACTRGWAAAP